MIEKYNPDLVGGNPESRRKELLKALTGENFDKERRGLETELTQFKEFMMKSRRQQKELSFLRSDLASIMVGSLAVDSTTGEISLKPGENALEKTRKIKEVEDNWGISPADEDRLRVFVHFFNNFTEKYELDLIISATDDPNQINERLEKAYWYKIHQLNNPDPDGEII